MGILSSVAAWKIYAAGGLVIAAAAGYAGSQVTAWQKDAKYSAMVATHAGVMQAYADRATAAEQTQREEEARRNDEREKISNDTRDKIQAAQAAAGAAASERDRLRKQLAAFTAGRRSAGPDPALVPGGSATPDAVDLLAIMFSESDDAAGILADALDRSHIAGNSCVSKYRSLTQQK